MKKQLILVAIIIAVLLVGGSYPAASARQGDSKTQMGVWGPGLTSGEYQWYVLLTNVAQQGEPVAVGQVGQKGDVPMPADYDGDGYDEFAVWRPGDKTFYIALEPDDWTDSPAWVIPFGILGDTPVVGDFDGDGADEAGVWDSETGEWHIALNNNTEPGQPALSAQVGQKGDVPVPADYDGDGADEFAVWRLADYSFYISLDNMDWVGNPTLSIRLNEAPAPGVTVVRTSPAYPVPADYDGDGVDEAAVWESGSGMWYASLDNVSWPDNILFAQVGQKRDVPVPGDYDGDGYDDFAVWRPSDMTYYVSLGNTDWGKSDTLIVEVNRPGCQPVPGTYSNPN